MDDDAGKEWPEFRAALKAARELTQAVQAAAEKGLVLDVVFDEFKVRDKAYKQVMVQVVSITLDD